MAYKRSLNRVKVSFKLIDGRILVLCIKFPKHTMYVSPNGRLRIVGLLLMYFNIVILETELY